MMHPSKKVVSVFIISIALVFSIIVAFGGRGASQAISDASSLVVGDKINVPQNTNWQNELGSVSNSIPIVDPNTTQTQDSETVTDIISKGLVANYLVLKQNNNLNNDTAQSLVDQATQTIDQNSNVNVLPSDLNIVENSGTKSINDYGENLGSILKKVSTGTKANELEILQSALNEQNPKKLNDLDLAIEEYKKMEDMLMRMPVPSIFVKAHIDTVKGVRGIILGLKQIKSVFSDPLLGLNGVQVFKNGGDLFVQAVRASSEFIMKNKVQYKQGSGGYYLLYGI